MKENIAKIWVDALRSGEYKQGGDYLCRNDRYCCLGVLCDLYEQQVKPVGFKKVRGSDDVATIYYGHCHETLPVDVMEWADMNSPVGAYIESYSDDAYSLSELNDGGHTFKELAKIIESEYEQL
jgi:hypothetical protein